MPDSNGRPLGPKPSVLTNWTNTLLKRNGRTRTHMSESNCIIVSTTVLGYQCISQQPLCLPFHHISFWWIRKELNLFLRIFSPPHKPLLPLIHKWRFYGNPTTVLAVALFFSHNRLWRPTSIYYSVSILHNIYRDMRPPTHGRLVRMKGLEPSRLSAQDPKSSVSTYFTTSAFHGKRSWTFLTICQFFICISVRNSWLAVSSPILNNTFLVVTLPPLTSFILNTSAVLGWCSFLRDASKQRVSSFTTSDII